MSTNTWTRTELADGLEIARGAASAWTFYWPGRMVVVPTSDGLAWAPRGDRRAVPPGTVLIAPPSAGHTRIEAPTGASFRVLFEQPLAPEAFLSGRVLLPQLWAPPASWVDDPQARTSAMLPARQLPRR